uniref:Uncharacterized protein n=1 Tax=Arundo donax TaxID=35708 RepID=A0A0A9ETR6_ARUDO
MGKKFTFPDANPAYPMPPLYSLVADARRAKNARTKQYKMMKHTRALPFESQCFGNVECYCAR